MDPTIHLRPARAAEADALSELALRSKAHWGYSAEFMAACREELRVDPEQIESEALHCVVAEQGAVLIGYYALERTDAAAFELEALFVEPAHIGTGVGRALIEHAQRTARALGGARLVIQGDPHAERFYLAAGGRRAGQRGSASVPGRSLPVFVIELADAE